MNVKELQQTFATINATMTDEWVWTVTWPWPSFASYRRRPYDQERDGR